MRTYYICDIHGDYKSFISLINHVHFNPEKDRLIIGGDMINRGPESAEMLQWARVNLKQYPERIHILIGNHEEMMIWFMNELSPMWMEFGGDDTITSFKKLFGSEKGWDVAEEYAFWLEKLPLIFEDEQAIYTHAGVSIGADQESQPRDIVWINQKELLQFDEKLLEVWTGGKYIYRGHNPFTTVHVKGQFIQCDLGNGTFDEEAAALALVDVQSKRYYRCSKDGKITEQLIEGF